MLNRQAIVDTLIEGCREGQFVLRMTRPDRSIRTIWRQQPEEGDLKNTTMEVVLPESAELTHIEPSLIAAGVLPEFWKGPDIAVADVRAYFTGGKVIKIARQGYDEPMTIPRALQAVVDGAIAGQSRRASSGSRTARRACCRKRFRQVSWSTMPGCSRRPRRSPRQRYSSTLPDAWSGETTTALAIADALSAKAGKPLPWATVRTAIDGAFQGRLLERTLESGPWPCDVAGAGQVKLKCASKPDLPRRPHNRPAPRRVCWSPRRT